MAVIDLATLNDDTRTRFAREVQGSEDFTLPHLAEWNYNPCSNHASIQEGSTALPPCQQCGIHPRKHQRIGAAWAYFEKTVLLADQTGTGKTITAAATLALMMEAGELRDPRRKVLIVVSPSAVIQWQRQLKRMLPNVPVMVPPKVKSKRIDVILHSEWQICVVGYQTFNNDVEVFRQKNIYMMIIDDVDPIGNNNTKTHYAINQISPRAERVLLMNATPMSKRLMQLYNTLLCIGGREFLGAPSTFERRHVKYHFGYRPQIVRGGEVKQVMQKNIVGYRNIDELTALLQPKVLRRTAADIDDVEMPALIPNNVYLDMYPAQREKYEALRRGVVRIQKESGGQITLTKANNAFMIGQKICDGLAFLEEADRPGTSVKMDWLEYRLVDGDFSDEKVVGFFGFKPGLRAFQRRLDAQGIGYETIWGEETDKHARMAAQDRFWDDPDCRVMLGTSALERSVNLQNARHVVAVDMIMNSARMTQLGGRVKRDGSAYRTVYLHQLMTNDSQEERYIRQLQKEQAVSDVIFGDNNEIYNADLSPAEMMRLITG